MPIEQEDEAEEEISLESTLLKKGRVKVNDDSEKRQDNLAKREREREINFASYLICDHWLMSIISIKFMLE